MTEASTAGRHLADKMEIIGVVDDVDNTVDAKVWSVCRGLFLDEISATRRATT